MASLDRSSKLSATPAERLVVLSPLLNLAAAAPTGAILRHDAPVRRLGRDGSAGAALLALSPDRRTVDIGVTLDPPRAATLHVRRLRRLDAFDAWDEDLLIVEIEAVGPPTPGAVARTRLSLDPNLCRATRVSAEELIEDGVRLSEIRAEAVLGIHVDPAPGRPQAGRAEARYLTERMLTELGAAQRSASAASASRHVHLATLYARHLRTDLR